MMLSFLHLLCKDIIVVHNHRGDANSQSSLSKCDTSHIHFTEQRNTEEILLSLNPDFSCTIEQDTHFLHTETVNKSSSLAC